MVSRYRDKARFLQSLQNGDVETARAYHPGGIFIELPFQEILPLGMTAIRTSLQAFPDQDEYLEDAVIRNYRPEYDEFISRQIDPREVPLSTGKFALVDRLSPDQLPAVAVQAIGAGDADLIKYLAGKGVFSRPDAREILSEGAQLVSQKFKYDLNVLRWLFQNGA
jgi:hypothetical protein